MPQIFKVGAYWVYFWSDESNPLEPVHVHISEGKPIKNGTKIWITKTGRCLVAHNKSQIPDKTLRNIIRIIDARSSEIIGLWYQYFGQISYYC
jgi:hypothetical protein